MIKVFWNEPNGNKNNEPFLRRERLIRIGTMNRKKRLRKRISSRIMTMRMIRIDQIPMKKIRKKQEINLSIPRKANQKYPPRMMI